MSVHSLILIINNITTYSTNCIDTDLILFTIKVP